MNNTNTLFHYVKNFDTLGRIIRKGLLPNFCKEELPNKNIVGVPMISFCDIPLTRADEHRTKYGKFAIGLNKSLNESINPVFYIKSSELKEAIVTLLNDFQLGKENYKNNINITLIGYIKLYYGLYEESETINYEEHEWRYIIKEDEQHKWLWGNDVYEEWRQKKKNSEKPESEFPPLKFAPSDVRYILVEKETDSAKLIEVIKKAKTLGGNKVTNEDDRDVLMTKILSIERLSDDF